jgi:thymidine kinase
MNYEGRIEVVFGPMFSGKSSELIRRVKRHQIAKKNCLVLNYVKDDRYSTGDFCSTHDKTMLKAVKIGSLGSVDDRIDPFDVIAIDEGQFFDDLVEFCEKWANKGKIVIVAALDATFQKKAFGRICDLLPLAEVVKK